MSPHRSEGSEAAGTMRGMRQSRAKTSTEEQFIGVATNVGRIVKVKRAYTQTLASENCVLQ